MLARCATSSGKHSRPASWLVWWKQHAWMRRLSGLTLPPSTLDHGAALWIASLRDCPANRTASPENGGGLAIPEASVRAMDRSSTSFASSKSVAPPWSSSRTSQLSLLESLSATDANIRGAISEENYQSWVTRSKTRSSSRRTTLARRISANASGSWPTSRAEDSESCGNHGAAPDALNAVAMNWPTPTIGESKDAARQTTQTGVMHDGTTLTDAARSWPTPMGAEAHSRPQTFGRGNQNTASAAEKWNTPDATLAPRRSGVERKANGATYSRNDPTFSEQAESWNTARAAERWPTPTETELGNTPESYLAMKAHMTSGPRSAVTHLPIFAQLWATPQAHDIKNVEHDTAFTNLPSQVKVWTTPTAHDANGMSPSESNRTTPNLEAQADSHSRRARTTGDGRPSSPSIPNSRPRLNPAFTAWLLGLPWWWTNPGVTNSARSAMAAYRSALRQHLQFLLNAS